MVQTSIKSEGFYRLPEIVGDRRRGFVGLLPISKSSWWAGVKTGRFPQPVKLGPRTTAWRVSDIAELIERLGKSVGGGARA